jgi:hypothetical protein
MPIKAHDQYILDLEYSSITKKIFKIRQQRVMQDSLNIERFASLVSAKGLTTQT